MLGAVRGSELWARPSSRAAGPALQQWLLPGRRPRWPRLDVQLDVAVSLPNGHVPADGLADKVAGALAAAVCPASRLVLSFTEETLLTSSAALVPELEAVRGDRRAALPGQLRHGPQPVRAAGPRAAGRRPRRPHRAGRPRRHRPRAAGARRGCCASPGLRRRVIAGGISTPELRDAAAPPVSSWLHGRALPHDLDRAALAALGGRPLAVLP